MKTYLICMALYMGQMNTLQSKQVVYLQPHSAAIGTACGGKLLELIGAPTLLNLPPVPPRPDSQGNPWSLDVKNLGPSAVTVLGTPHFSTHVIVNQTVHIYSNGTAYFQKW